LANTWESMKGKEFVPLGMFWSGDWDVPEQDLYAHTTGRDRLELLRNSIFSTSEVYVNENLYDLAITVLIDAGMSAGEYFIDDDLKQYVIPYAYFDSQSHREALRKIAEASLGQAYCDREGILRIEGATYLDSLVPVDNIARDDYFTKNNPTKWSEVANYIEVETQPLTLMSVQEVYKSNELESIGAGRTKSITAFYNEIPCINAVAAITGTGTISSVNYYAWGAAIEVASATAGTFELSINAQPLKVLNTEKIIKKDDNSIASNGQLKYTYPVNPLVQTRAQAENIASNLLLYYREPRKDIELDWRGNPAMILGDRITVTDRNGANDYYVISQQLEFDGALKSMIRGRKA